MKREGLLELNEAVQHPGKKLRFEIETELAREEDLDLIEPVRGTIEAVSTGNILLVKSRFATRIVTECARCGSPVESPLEFTMDDQFQVEGVPSAYSHDSFAYVVADEPEPLFEQNALIVDNYVRQGLIVNLPQQTLCSGSWDGPCQSEPLIAEEDDDPGHPAFKGLAALRAEETS
ncbi:MAG: DUF177 domain-containing protein [Fimbriimonadaceae bacterium]|nr:DUF177 domain-containing protein [Fimbriimonadaceae bacterium]QYK58210.1 MAG: DUF177 domain-containing protein [Fimbriimonadaceae bacterium]